MLTADLVVVSNHATLTLPGSESTMTYSQIATVLTNEVRRRKASTANTTPQVLRIAHNETGGTGFKKRIRSLVRYDYTDKTADVEDTGGVVPSFSVQLTIDRPENSSGAITDAMLKTGVGVVLDVILTSGQLDKLLNQEA